MPPRNRRPWDDDDDEIEFRRRPRKRGGMPVWIPVVAVVGFLVVGGAVAMAVWLVKRHEAVPVGNGVEIVVPKKHDPNSVEWFRLTPDKHPVTVKAPGQPKQMAAPFLGVPHDAPFEGWEAEGPNRNRYFFMQTQYHPGPDGGPEPGLFGKASFVGLGEGYGVHPGGFRMTGMVSVDDVAFEQYENNQEVSGKCVFRIAFRQGKVYLYGVSGPTGKPAADPLVPVFLDSFRLDKAAALKAYDDANPPPNGIPGVWASYLFDDDKPSGHGKPLGNVSSARRPRPGARPDPRRATAADRLARHRSRSPAGKPWSFSLWFKTDRADGTLFLSGYAPVGKTIRYEHFELGLLPEHPYAKPATQAIFFENLASADALPENVYIPARVTGDWVHVAFTRDAAGNARLFVNGLWQPGWGRERMMGQLGGMDAMLGGLADYPWANPAMQLIEPKRPRKPFVGLIDEVIFANVAWSETDVRRLARR